MSYVEVLLISARAATVALLFMIPVAAVAAWFLARSDNRLRHVVDVAVTLPLALPPVVVGFALLWLVGDRGPFGGALSGVAFTWIMMSCAAAVVALPLTVRAFASAFSEVDSDLERTARNLGGSRLRVLWTITLPLARRGLAAGLLLGFVRGVRRVRSDDRGSRQHTGRDAGHSERDLDRDIHRRLRHGLAAGCDISSCWSRRIGPAQRSSGKQAQNGTESRQL